MSALTPAFVMDLEKNMRVISAQEYQRLLGSLWYSRVAKTMPSGAKSERVTWLLDTATIEYTDRLGGGVTFDDILSRTTEFENRAATKGLKLNRFQLEDHDGNGIALAEHWSRQIGAYSAYWPQKQIAAAIRNGGEATSTTYDGRPFFDTAHPVNPFDSSLGTFRNDFTSTSSGVYPGAVRIDTGVTVDVALDNLQKAKAYIQSLKMPNGEDPRGLRVAGLIVPPALAARAVQLTQAKFIAQDAGSGGGGADVEAVIANMGYGQLIVADELSSAFTNGSDTTFYIVAEQLAGDQLGALVYVNREPFSVVYNGEMTSAELSRMNEMQWIVRGRNVVGYGHPYLLFRCKAS